jgi:probable phosphoglycerate mutase
LLLQGLLKGEGKARYGDAWGMWQKQADAFAIDEHAPVRELWYR